MARMEGQVVSGIAAALSGLTAAQTQLSTTAHNVANAQTDGFKKNRVVLEESASGGVSTTIEKVDSPGFVQVREGEAGQNPVEVSNVDLGEAMVNLIVGQRFFEANLATLETQDKILGNLLDLRE